MGLLLTKVTHSLTPHFGCGFGKVGIVDILGTGIDVRRNLFDWDDLQIFHAVATTGSMSAAAQALGCQQSTVSKRMRQLESRLGSQLIERRAGGVVLTPAGETALDYAITMQRSAHQLESRVAGQDKALAGDVAVRAPDGLATYWLGRHLPEFMRVNPDIELSLVSDRSPTGGETLPALTLTFVPEKSMDATALALGTVHFMPVASRNFITTYGAPESLPELMALRFLHLEQYDAALTLWDDKAKAVNSLIKYSYRTDMSAALFEAIRHGGGVAMAPTYLAALYPDDFVVLDFGFHQGLRFWLKFMPGAQEINRVKCVADWICNVFNPKTNPWFRDEFCHPEDYSTVEVIRPKK
ncbi:LysR family transcriptional regulator [Maricaulis sp. CAU 1757]